MPKKTIANRIVGQGVKPADQFQANPENFRRHPQAQRDAVAHILGEVGWITGVIENVRTGNLIDGHERVWQALENNDDVPFVQVDLSEDEERFILAAFDAVGDLATRDVDTLEKLLDALTDQQAEFVEGLIDAATGPSGADGLSNTPNPNSAATLYEQAVQLNPRKEFVAVMCENADEFEKLVVALELPIVRRGGYKDGSVFDKPSRQRVIKAGDLLKRLAG